MTASPIGVCVPNEDYMIAHACVRVLVSSEDLTLSLTFIRVPISGDDSLSHQSTLVLYFNPCTMILSKKRLEREG